METKHPYLAGLEDGIKRFAYWKDGEQYVGTCGTRLADALTEAMREPVPPTCNTHDGLVETLRTIKCQCEREEAGDIQFDTIDWIRQKAQAALAGIKGE